MKTSPMVYFPGSTSTTSTSSRIYPNSKWGTSLVVRRGQSSALAAATPTMTGQYDGLELSYGREFGTQRVVPLTLSGQEEGKGKGNRATNLNAATQRPDPRWLGLGIVAEDVLDTVRLLFVTQGEEERKFHQQLINNLTKQLGFN